MKSILEATRAIVRAARSVKTPPDPSVFDHLETMKGTDPATKSMLAAQAAHRRRIEREEGGEGERPRRCRSPAAQKRTR
jgi:hypothetical protein